MMARVSPFYMGTVSDHIYDTCPAFLRSKPVMERHDMATVSRFSLDPEGTEVCGWCQWVWRARTDGR